jgi:hypothetical protein
MHCALLAIFDRLHLLPFLACIDLLPSVPFLRLWPFLGLPPPGKLGHLALIAVLARLLLLDVASLAFSTRLALIDLLAIILSYWLSLPSYIC